MIFIKSKTSESSRSHTTLHDAAGVLPLRGHKTSENRKEGGRQEERNKWEKERKRKLMKDGKR